MRTLMRTLWKYSFWVLLIVVLPLLVVVTTLSLRSILHSMRSDAIAAQEAAERNKPQVVLFNTALSAGGGFICLPANSLERKPIVFVLSQKRGMEPRARLGQAILWASDFWGRGSFTVFIEHNKTKDEKEYMCVTFLRE